MASRHIETYCQDLLFPVGALILSEGIDRLVRAGRLDPIPYFRRHVRGDWGDVSDGQWQANGIALGVWGAMEPKTNVSPTTCARCLLPRHPPR
ncbi:hypothetical protein [Pseudomonas aeruginosa]|uniref:hypothetical protein n=1 Tax=Pseudomonas aeruginosa TaxID=287 RepID=UPI000AD2F855